MRYSASKWIKLKKGWKGLHVPSKQLATKTKNALKKRGYKAQVRRRKLGYTVKTHK